MLPNQRVVLSHDQAEKLAKIFGLPFEEGSHKSDVFDRICGLLRTPRLADLRQTTKVAIINVASTNPRIGSVQSFIDFSIKRLKKENGRYKMRKRRVGALADRWKYEPPPWEKLPITKNSAQFEHAIVIGSLPDGKFYQTPEWRRVRYEVLKHYGPVCMLCGASQASGVAIHVDHIEDRSLNPELALVPENLQVLCEDCHMGKLIGSCDDWRMPTPPKKRG